MPVTKIGIVYYPDDPHKRVFRRVYPAHDDSELDGPVTGGDGKPLIDGDGNSDWHTFGLGPTHVATPRAAQMDKIDAADATFRKRGTPWTLASEPVIYWVNAAAALAALTSAQNDQLATWLAANPQWSNNFINLGDGDVATLTAACVAPCWIIVVGGGTNPAIGALRRSTIIKNVSLALWTA